MAAAVNVACRAIRKASYCTTTSMRLGSSFGGPARRPSPPWRGLALRRAFADVAAGSDESVNDDAGMIPPPSEAQVFRSTRAEHHRTFRWGVGSRWRQQGVNRFTPVHKEHAKEVMVRDDYYEIDNPNIMWEDLNEAWEVYWYENNKLNAKPFPVKKYGVEQAKKEAAAFHDVLVESGRAKSRPRVEQPNPGIFFDGRLQSWVCLYWQDGRPRSHAFSATKYGFEGAKILALAKQRDPVSGVLPTRWPGGGTPASHKPLGNVAPRSRRG